MKNILILVLAFTSSALFGQLTMNGVQFYGNEWIDYSTTHVKLTVEQEGMYKVSYDELISAGLTAGQIQGGDLQIHSMGRQQPLHVSTSGTWGSGDYLVFHGEGQKGELDAHLFEDPTVEHLNPEYSIYSDARAYYISLREGNPERFLEKSNDLNIPNLPLPEKFFMEKELIVFNEFEWSPGTPVTQDVHYSHFVANEGFASPLRRETDIEFQSTDYYDGTNPPISSLRLRTGANNVNHLVEFTFNNSFIREDDYSGARINEYDIDIPANFIRTNNVNRVKIKGFSGADNTNVAFAEFTYPRSYNANNASSVKFFSSQSNFQQYVEYPNFGGADPLVFDVDNKCFVRAVLEGGTAKFLLPSGAVKGAKCFLVSESDLLSPLTIERRDFVQVDNMNPEFLILTSEVLNVEAGGANPIQEYMAFRSSEIGGGYTTGAVNVEDIYDQFGYGVAEHSLAVRNFAHYVKDRWPDFEMVFIVGKSLTYANKDKTTNRANLVPTYGRPGSDNLLFSENGKVFPYVGVGRLAARTTEDVFNYLDKARSNAVLGDVANLSIDCLLYTSPSPRDGLLSRMPSSA